MKAVIFDMDGTLVDSVDLHAKAWQETFQHFGHPRSFDEIRAQIGKGGDQLMPVFLPKTEVEEKGEEMEKFRGDLFQKKFLPSVKSFPQARPLFQRILKEGWKIALASSAKKEELKTYKQIAQISDLADTETSSDDAEKSKRIRTFSWLPSSDWEKSLREIAWSWAILPMMPRLREGRACGPWPFAAEVSQRRNCANRASR